MYCILYRVEQHGLYKIMRALMKFTSYILAKKKIKAKVTEFNFLFQFQNAVELPNKFVMVVLKL